MFALNKFKTLPYWLDKRVTSLPNIFVQPLYYIQASRVALTDCNYVWCSEWCRNFTLHLQFTNPFFLFDFPAKMSIVIHSDNTYSMFQTATISHTVI